MNNRRIPPSRCGRNPTGTPNECFISGRRAGYAAGVNQSIPITNDLSKDVIRDIARLNRIPRYSTMTKDQMITALLLNNVLTFKPIELGRPL